MSSTVTKMAVHRRSKSIRMSKTQLLQILDNQRTALKRLFSTGLLFHSAGSEAARALLLAQELSLKAIDLFDAMTDSEVEAKIASAEGSESVRLAKNQEQAHIRKLKQLLARIEKITEQSGRILKSLHPSSAVQKES